MCCISDDIKKNLVNAIKEGLYDAQKIYDSGMMIRNSVHFYKMDTIHNSVINELKNIEDVEIVIIKRGNYNLPLIYFKSEMIICSLMSSSRYSELMKRSDHSVVHYFDALVDFNSNLDIDRNQQVIDESLFNSDNFSIDKIKNQVIAQLGGVEPSQYITIEMEMKGLHLVGVNSIITSEYLEVFERESWSQFIEIDYNDLEYQNTITDDIEDDLNISLKDSINRKDDITEKDIKPKMVSKLKQS